ncbi:SPFH domain-containing protein [Streptosporangium sp. NPDC051023]|uniref:SPFH domain-containing protein n=1 Tax=Streptosporangium sp. NPDC051023 TaxID=3155410 RepID=UPI00344BA3FB
MSAMFLVKIPKGKVGIVRRKFGRVHPDDEGREIRVNESSPGTRAATLQADRFYTLPSYLYEVEIVERTEVPLGTIGVVVAKDGAPPSSTRTLSAHVECRDFQDGVAFLRNGGMKGRQPGVLQGGASYAINTELFEVVTVRTPEAGRYGLTTEDLAEVRIQEGTSGVVVVHEGEPAGEEEGAVGRRVPGHNSFQLPLVFLNGGGQRGLQEEPLGSGVYRINPWFARVIHIPTRILVLDWKKPGSKRQNNLDSSLEQIRINVEGHWVRFDMTQTIQIPAKAAPGLVSRVGEQKSDQDDPPVRRFVDKVLAPAVEGYFQRAAAGRPILDFLTNAEAIRLELAEQVREALSAWQVTPVDTVLNEFEPEGTSLDELRQSIVSEREKRQLLQHTRENKKIERELEIGQIGVERERRKLESVALAEQVRLLSRDHVAMERFLAQLKEINVPTYVGGNADALLQLMPMQAAQELINNAMRGASAVDAQRRREITPGASQGSVEAALKKALTDQRSAQLSGASQREQTVVVYLSRDDGHADVQDAVDRFAQAFGWAVTGESAPTTAPWFQTITIQADEGGTAATPEEMEAELRRAAALQGTDDPWSRPGAAVRLLESLSGTPLAVLLIGPLLLVEVHGEHALLSLGHRQLSHLIRRPGRLLTEPLEVVADLRRSMGELP